MGLSESQLKASEILNRLTGISTPLGGLSWEASESSVSAARRVIAFLEDRRVLYIPDQLEVPAHCVHSILGIRQLLSTELSKLDSDSELPLAFVLCARWRQRKTANVARQRLRFLADAWRILRGIEAMEMVRKGRVRWIGKDDVVGRAKFFAKLFGITAQFHHPKHFCLIHFSQWNPRSRPPASAAAPAAADYTQAEQVSRMSVLS